MSDIISQAMGILGGGKGKQEAPKSLQEQTPRAPVPVRPSAPAPTHTPAHARAPMPAPAPVRKGDIRERMSKVERKVVSELARYAALHAAVIDLRHEMERGQNIAVVESKLEQVLGNAKVVIK